jgi:hypothetical protein
MSQAAAAFAGSFFFHYAVTDHLFSADKSFSVWDFSQLHAISSHDGLYPQGTPLVLILGFFPGSIYINGKTGWIPRG